MPLFLSDDEFRRCSNNATVVAEKADAFIRGLLNELETIKARADASDINAEQNCLLVEQKYVSLSAEFSKLEARVAELQSTLNQQLGQLSDVQTQNQKSHAQLVEKDGEIERLKTEVGELHKSKRQLIELVEQKDLELSEKNANVNLSENAAQKEARLNEVEAELARSRAACTRLSEEKEIIQRQNTWLNDELTAKVNSFFEERRKHNDSEADLSSKLEDAERRFSDCSKSLQWSNDRVRELEMKLKSMHQELIRSKEAAAAKEEQFSAELSTVNKLHLLYKESSEEWTRKAGELEGVIKVMEADLKQVEDDYKVRFEKESSVRKQAEKEAADLKAKLEKCDAEIETSKRINELNLLPLSSFTTEPWSPSIETDSIVEENRLVVPKVPAGVSGTALAASLMRDGWSLAKLYVKYQEAVDSLRHEQLGRKESEAILQRVLYELEEKAEAIIDERVEHEKMAEAYSMMNQTLQNSLSERGNLEKTIQELKAEIRRHERDYSLAQKEIGDLQRQVTALLKECRDIQLRCGSIQFDAVDDNINIAFGTNAETEAEKVISEHLLTFKDINGLVEQNVQLRRLVRCFSDQIENKEMEFKENLEIELKKHTEEAASKVAAVLQRAEEQGRMIEALHASVAMYKRLYEGEHNLRLSHPQSSEVPADGGRNIHKTVVESSQEVAKKSLEQAAEHVRRLEDDLAKSRSEIVVLRSECDKLALEANFAKERLDNSTKEFEHQKAEAIASLARNVEFSQLIVDYQRKLQGSSDSLFAADELSRKQSMELSVLKQEKEVILNAERRASDEVRSLSERVQRLQASLHTIQGAEEVQEEARTAVRRSLEEHTKKLEREWAEAKKELQEERENMRTFTRDREQTIKNYMRQVEELNKDLANALHLVSAAESRASVAEEKLASLQRKIGATDDKLVKMDDAMGTPTLSGDEVVTELRMAKDELEKLKQEAEANKAHMLQYKSIAGVTEHALKQIELAHENSKIEASNTKKALEAELQSLREKIMELENESTLKSEEMASATARKDEALASAFAEISILKEEILAKSSKISAVEVQMSCLKEDLDKEHKKWRAAQTNYERQVILQSETIQELTKTSQALALLQEEASELRKLADAQKIENNELKAKWEEEKAVLEKSKNDAERRYDEMNEQNKILHSRFEALHIQWAEKERSSAGLPSRSSSADTFGDAGLQNVTSYLRHSKEIAETEISLLRQEKLRLQSQLESALKAAESAQASLKSEHANARSLPFAEEEFKSLQLQVREINLLRESNMQLREENKHNFEECQKLREIEQKSRGQIEYLENHLREREIELESCKNGIEVLKMEKDQLNQKVSELLERCKNVDMEDYDRLKNLVKVIKNKLKEKETQIEETGRILLEKQGSISQLEQDVSRCKLELAEREKRINDHLQVEAKLKMDKAKALLQHKRRIETLSKEKEDLVKENQQLSKQLDEIKQGKSLTSDTGAQALKEEKDSRAQTLETHLARLRDELNKEKEANRMERTRWVDTEKAMKDSYSNVEQEKTMFINEFEKYNEALKKLSDEVEKLKPVIGNLPEGTNVVQVLAGFNLDERTAPYISAVENFEKEAHSIFSELGGCSPGEPTLSADASAPATGPLIPVQSPSVIPSVAPGASISSSKASEESKKSDALPKTNVETRKAARRLVRPPLVKPQEPPGDVEMSEVEASQSGGKPLPSSDTENRGNFTFSSQPLVRKRGLPASTSELHEGSGVSVETGSNVTAPVVKKSRGPDSPQESVEGQRAATAELTGSQPATEESFDGGELPQGPNEEVTEPQNKVEITVEKTEESKDPQPSSGTNQEESQGDKACTLEENLDLPLVSDDIQRDKGEQDNQQSTMELGIEREEGEPMPDVGSSDAFNPVENVETREVQSEPSATPEPSPARADDEALEAGEISSSELSNDDKNDEGDVVEEAADVSEKSNDAKDTIVVEIDQAAEPAPVASEGTLTSNAAASKVGLPVQKQGTSSSVSIELDDIKQASPISSTSTTINLSERARERAQLRQAGVVSTQGRGRGRLTRGRVGRGRGGRRPPPSSGA